MNKGFKKYFKNTSWLFVEKILRLLLGLFVGVWVARYLGPKDFGVMSFTIACVGILTPISRLGLTGIISREVAQDECDMRELLVSALVLKVIGSFTVIFLYCLYIYITKEDILYFYLGFIYSSILIIKSYEVIELYFKAKVKAKFVAIASILSLVFSSFFKVLFIIREFDIIYFGFANLMESVLFIYLLFIFFKGENISFNIKNFKKTKAFNLLKESLPLIFAGFAGVIFLKVDQIMIEEILGSYQLGLYSSAVRISSVFYFIPITIALSVQAALVNAKKINEHLYYERLKKLFALMAILAYLIILPISYISSDIIIAIYGDEFKLAGNILGIHIVSSLFVFIGSPRGLWIVNEGQHKFVLLSNVGACLLNIVLNWLLIPLYGIEGAAWSSLVSTSFAYLFSGIFYKPIKRVMYMQLISLTLIGLFPKFNPSKN